MSLNEQARARVQQAWGEPLFLADWMRVLMIHFEVDPEELGREVPFELDLFDGRAFVSLVAFTMENMRPRIGSKLGAWLFKPIATHDYLNLRTYVRHDGEPGIHFLAEWLSSWLAVQLGPRTFGLPYRHGRIRYQHDLQSGLLSGQVDDAATGAELEYVFGPELGAPVKFGLCESGSLDEWLMERYTAFNLARRRARFFRVWHPSWMTRRMAVKIGSDSLLRSHWPFFNSARLIGANFSPGIRDVWMGWPHGMNVQPSAGWRVRKFAVESFL